MVALRSLEKVDISFENVPTSLFVFSLTFLESEFPLHQLGIRRLRKTKPFWSQEQFELVKEPPGGNFW